MTSRFHRLGPHIPAALAVFLLALAGPAQSAAAPFSGSDGDDFLSLWSAGDRAAVVESLTVQIHQGVSELTQHYIRGGTSPLPPKIAYDFLMLRSVSTGRTDLKDAALAMAAAFKTLLLNDYVTHGLPTSDTESEKQAGEQAELLALFTAAYRDSDKKMFADGAEKTADDLVAWAIDRKSGTVLTSVRMDPETAPGAPAGPPVRARVAAALAEAGAVLERQDWRNAAARVVPESVDAAAATLESNADRNDRTPIPDPARTLLAVVDAEMSVPDADLAAAAAGLVPELKRLSNDESIDVVHGSWSALAMTRYGFFTHDDSLTAAAAALLDRLELIGPPVTGDVPKFSARCAAAFALEFQLHPAPMAYIVGDPAGEAARALMMAALRAVRPGRLIGLHAPDEENLLYPGSSDGTPIVYVCSGQLCAPPVEDGDEVKALLEEFALPGDDGFGP